jgi:hypothetical protein
VNSFIKSLPRLAAAAVFAVGASTAVVVGDAAHAGAPVNGITTAAAQPASAGVAVGIAIGGGRYYRYGYRGGAWVNLGYGYAPAPGYVNGYYYGYAPPVVGFGYGYAPRPYYGRPYGYGYARGYYGHANYGRATYGRGAYGGGNYGHGGYRR